jgi:hypothetical protein
MWNANIQRNIGKNLLVDSTVVDLNAIPLSALQYRDLLNDEQFNRSLRPYPQYRGFVLAGAYPRGRNKNTAITARLEQRSSHGMFWSASYNFGKQLDDFSGPYGKQDFYRREMSGRSAPPTSATAWISATSTTCRSAPVRRS